MFIEANENANQVVSKYGKLKFVVNNLKAANQTIKSNLVKAIRPEQLTPIKDKDDSDILLG